MIKFFKIIDTSAFSLPSKHISGCQLPEELPMDLLHGPLISVRYGDIIPPLQRPYDDPYSVLRCGPRSFTIWVRTRGKVISVSHLMPCKNADVKPNRAVCNAAANHLVLV